MGEGCHKGSWKTESREQGEVFVGGKLIAADKNQKKQSGRPGPQPPQIMKRNSGLGIILWSRGTQRGEPREGKKSPQNTCQPPAKISTPEQQQLI